MLEKSTCFWLFTILIITQNFGLSKGILTEKWFKQYVNHFDYQNDKTWWMRYYEDDQFYQKQTGPIFIMICGEWEMKPEVLEENSVMYEMAGLHGAMMYSIEHRYYGRSHPVSDTSYENLRYLSIQQVLEDIAFFIEKKKNELNNPKAFVMVFGGSYAGNLAAWMRIEHPDLVQGALASNAPVYVKANFAEYFGFVGDSLHEFNEKCAMNIKEAFLGLETILRNSPINSIGLQNDFKLCSLQDFSQPSEIPYMIHSLANIFAYSVISNRMETNGKTSMENLCITMNENEDISPYYRLTNVFKGMFLQDDDSCIDLMYNLSIENYRQISWESEMVTGRLWAYQTCTELGYYSTSSSTGSIFGSLLPLQYFMNRCKDLFKESVNLDNLNHNIEKIDHLFNSKLRDTTNIIFVNADHDPWRLLSVVSDLNANSPAILLKDTPHVGFLIQNKATQTRSVVNAKCQVSFMISEWLRP